MSRGPHNWTAEEIVRFLKDYKFALNHTKGSHYYYIGHYGHILRQVCIPFHGSKSIKPRTFNSIMRQSGIPKEKWFSK